MTTELLPNSLRPFWKQIIVSFVVVYVAINIFRIGGDKFIFNLNTSIVYPLALSVMVLVISLWRRVAIAGRDRLIWSGLAIGWTMWATAEFWWAIAAVVSQEVPYPSWADFFWLAGYIPMYTALWGRIRSLPHHIGPLKKAGLWSTSLVIVGGTIFFVLVPILQNNDPDAILESALNIFYPLADLILLILVLRIFFAYQQGMYGRAWMWLSAGFVLLTFADFVFSYASTAGLYYPDGQANSLSLISDIPYNLSYVLWFIGLYTVRTMQGSYQNFTKVDTPLPLVPNTHILIFLKSDDTVIDVSQNYPRIFPLETIQDRTISEVLGISPGDTDSLLTDIKANTFLKERPICVNTRQGQQQALVSGTSTADHQGVHFGVTILLLRLFAEDFTLDELLTDYQRGMLQSLLSKTETEETEVEAIKQLLSKYYLQYIRAFIKVILPAGGSIMADAFLAELQAVATQHGWKIGIQPDALLDVRLLSLKETQECLPVLLETARRIIAQGIDESTANTIVQDVRSQFDEPTLKSVAHFQKAKV